MLLSGGGLLSFTLTLFKMSTKQDNALPTVCETFDMLTSGLIEVTSFDSPNCPRLLKDLRDDQLDFFFLTYFRGYTDEYDSHTWGQLCLRTDDNTNASPMYLYNTVDDEVYMGIPSGMYLLFPFLHMKDDSNWQLISAESPY